MTLGGIDDDDKTPTPLWQVIVLEFEYLAAVYFVLVVGFCTMYWLGLKSYQTSVFYRHIMLVMQGCLSEPPVGIPYKGLAVLSLYYLGVTAGITVLLGLILQTLAVIRNFYRLVGFGGQLLLFIVPMAALSALIFHLGPWHVPFGFGMSVTAFPCLILVPRFFSDFKEWVPEWFGFGKKQESPLTKRPDWGHVRAAQVAAEKARGAATPQASVAASAPKAVSESPDARYGRILGLKGTVTGDEVRKRYLTLMAEYHPDKVNHLGAKLKEVAEEESRHITEAYEYFRKKYNLG
jgi:hypothetical protein